MAEEVNEFAVMPSYPLSATDRSSISSSIDNSVNKTMPWIVIVGILAGISLGLGIASITIAKIETEHVEQRLSETTKQYRLLDNDWQILNAWLSAHNVKRDEHGNLYFEDPYYVQRSTQNNH